MTTRFYRHWRDVPKETWCWPNFSPAEIACRGTGSILIDEAALDRLQTLRSRLGKPLIVNSAYRSPEHNRRVGGAKHSKHLEGAAFDPNRAIYLQSLYSDYSNATPEEMQALAQRYLVARPGLRISVLPEGAGAGAGQMTSGR